MVLQYIIITLVLLACIGYVGWRIAYLVKNAGSPCHGCKLHQSCSKKAIRQWQPKERNHCFTPGQPVTPDHTTEQP